MNQLLYYSYLLYHSSTGSVPGRDLLQPLQQLVHRAGTARHDPAGGGVRSPELAGEAPQARHYVGVWSGHLSGLAQCK